MKYVVTAINRLTREREAISNPLDKLTALRLCAEQKKLHPRKRVWFYPRVKPMPWREERIEW